LHNGRMRMKFRSQTVSEKGKMKFKPENKSNVAIVLSALSLVVSTADFFASRARSKRLEDRETAIEAKESTLENRIENLNKALTHKRETNNYSGRRPGAKMS
jgi:hypothetical protein